MSARRTFLSLAPPLSFFRIFYKLKLPTDNLKQPNPIIPVHPRHSPVVQLFPSFAKNRGGLICMVNVSTICRRADNSPLFTGRNVVFLQRPCYDSCRDATVQNAIARSRASNSLAPKTRGCRVPGVVCPSWHSKPFAVSQAPAVCPGRARRRPHQYSRMHARFIITYGPSS